MSRVARALVLMACAATAMLPLMAVGAWGMAPNTSTPQLSSPQAAMEKSDMATENEDVGTVADEIFALGADRGFAGLETDYNQGSITVFWAGNVPADVQRFAASSPRGIAVTVVATGKYSRHEAEAARARIQASPIAQELKLYSISVGYRGEGLTLVSGLAEVSDSDIVRLRSVAGIDGIVVVAAKSEPIPFLSRVDDAAPWKGGIRTVHYVVNEGTFRCSSGFAVLDGRYGRLLSANHCDKTANGTIKDGAGELISNGGSAVSNIPALDSLLLDPASSPATTALIYYGAYNTSSTKIVKSFATNWPGDPVCSGGASLGTRCGTVYDDNDHFYINGYWVPVIQASAANGVAMAGQGDSGGPVTKLVTGGVQARGIVLGNDPTFLPLPTASCAPVNPDAYSASYICSQQVSYVPISLILNAWGVSLETG